MTILLELTGLTKTDEIVVNNQKEELMICDSPWSSKPWVISCPITIPIPPKFKAWSCFSLKNGGCKIPAGNTVRERERGYGRLRIKSVCSNH